MTAEKPAPIPRDPIAAAVIRRVEARGGNPTELRAAFGLAEGWLGLCLNAVLFAGKLGLGLLTGSVALMADAVHTAADSVTSGVLIVSSRIARRPADREHPFGHGRVESVSTIIIAVLLGVAGIEFLESSVKQLLHPGTIEAGWWVVAVVLVAAAIKEWNARFAMTLAERSGSQAIKADAWHHRSDVAATLLVAVGIVGAKFGLPWLDGAMGILVSLVILGTAIQLAREAIDPLLGQAPSPEEIREVAQQARQVDGVTGVHDIVIHRYGDVRLISLHVETSDQLNATESHALAEMVQEHVGGGRQGHVVAHVDPINRDHPRYPAIVQTLTALVANDERLQSFHDLRIVGDERQFNAVFDLVLEPEFHDQEATIGPELVPWVVRETGAAAVVIHIEPPFAYGS